MGREVFVFFRQPEVSWDRWMKILHHLCLMSSKVIKPKCFDLLETVGHVVEFSSDQYGTLVLFHFFLFLVSDIIFFAKFNMILN
ncbi:hypothetical protein L1987_35168 [Smallanthus sonchifolius]|uniref:Uncharacterized protein n=1 Tax=Smallanthus sonchifolius TaxID=185202 RepID=A0ACB9HX12_9ASTR|nr:hypothetical protein L1987_35168 [Smallanthus sonchifolius]